MTDRHGQEFAERFVSAARTELMARADAERARGMATYMRDQFSFLGVPAPGQREVLRSVAAELRVPSEAQLRAVAKACWRQPEREFQYVACGYINRHAKKCSAEFIDVAAELLTTKPWWDTVDSLAQRTVGQLVRAHPQLTETMRTWLAGDDLWLARSAMLHQNRYKADTDADLLFEFCLARAGDREFFIRKAIGWALREYSKTAPASVEAFVADHAVVLSPLSQREALKWLARRRAP